MELSDNSLFVITGCTAVGKSEYAIGFAEGNNAEIVSCDSLAVYKHMDIGTAKPTPDEQRRVKHHCLDLVEPSCKFDVAMFISAAKAAVKEITLQGKNAVIVGGSGFYLKSFFAPTIDSIAIPEEVENFVKSERSAVGIDGLVKMLTSLNNGRCPPIDIKNPRRVESALKRCLASKKTFDEVQQEFIGQPSVFSRLKKHTILLERSREDLERRIYERTRHMVDGGLIDEVRALLAAYELTPSASSAIGYCETIRWLGNPTTKEDLVNEIAKNTLKLVKKQKTWLRRQIPIDEKVSL